MKPISTIRYSKKLLFTTFNCAKAQLIPLQEVQGIQDDDLIMALTGLAGGILNNGSTCGVVVGGGQNDAAWNALKHGLQAKHVVIPGEKRKDFLAFRKVVIDDLAPEGALETLLAERIVGKLAPNTWDEVGGPGSIAPLSFGRRDVLVVSQTRRRLGHEVDKSTGGGRHHSA